MSGCAHFTPNGKIATHVHRIHRSNAFANLECGELILRFCMAKNFSMPKKMFMSRAPLKKISTVSHLQKRRINSPHSIVKNHRAPSLGQWGRTSRSLQMLAQTFLQTNGQNTNRELLHESPAHVLQGFHAHNATVRNRIFQR